MNPIIVLCVLLGASSTQAYDGHHFQTPFPGFPALKNRVTYLSASINGLLPVTPQLNLDEIYQTRQDDIDAACYEVFKFVEDKTAYNESAPNKAQTRNRCSILGIQEIDLSRVQTYNDLKKCYDSRSEAIDYSKKEIEPLIKIGNQLIKEIDESSKLCSGTFLTAVCVTEKIPTAMRSVKDFEIQVFAARTKLQAVWTSSREEVVVRCFQNAISVLIQNLDIVKLETEKCLES